MNKYAVVLATLILLQACAVTPQQVKLQPRIQTSASDMGHGKKVYLKTVDERISSSIGTRGISGFGAEITSTDDVATIVNTAVSNALKGSGFEVVSDPSSTPIELRAEVRNLEYTLTPGVFMGTLRTESAIKGICSVGRERRYEYLYRGGSEEKVFVTQFAEENATHINTALAESIQKLVQDSDLTDCLSSQ